MLHQGTDLGQLNDTQRALWRLYGLFAHDVGLEWQHDANPDGARINWDGEVPFIR